MTDQEFELMLHDPQAYRKAVTRAILFGFALGVYTGGGLALLLFEAFSAAAV